MHEPCGELGRGTHYRRSRPDRPLVERPGVATSPLTGARPATIFCRASRHATTNLKPSVAGADLSNRLLSWLLGPEVYWFAIYLASRLLAAATTRGDPAGILLLERTSRILPTITVPLSFAIFYWFAPAPASRGWLTARLMVATFIGLNAALITITEAIDYGDSRNSGTYGFWFGGVMLGGLLWVVGYLVVVWTGARGSPS